MSYILTSTIQPTVGIQPRYLVVRCRNAQGSALSAGQCVRLDFSQASEEPGLGGAVPPNASTSKWANVVLSPANSGVTNSGLYGVVQESIVTAGEGLIMFAGFSNVTTASATFAVGESIGTPASSGTAGTLARVHTSPIFFTATASGGASTSPRALILGQFTFGANPT